MHNLGLTRSDRQPTHLLQTPDTFVGMPLPGFDAVNVIVHAAPSIGAAFTQYTAEFEAGGSLGPAHGQRFLYVLEGSITVALGGASAGVFCARQAGDIATVKMAATARARFMPVLNSGLCSFMNIFDFTGNCPSLLSGPETSQLNRVLERQLASLFGPSRAAAPQFPSIGKEARERPSARAGQRHF